MTNNDNVPHGTKIRTDYDESIVRELRELKELYERLKAEGAFTQEELQQMEKSVTKL